MPIYQLMLLKMGFSNVICVNDEHSSNADSPIDADDWIIISVNDEHWLKKHCSIDVTEDGINALECIFSNWCYWWCNCDFN